MNLEDAYKIHHVASGTYGGTLKYSPKCIFCSSDNSISLMNDGGSYRRCMSCRKEFKATILNESVTNYIYSTRHLSGTN